MQKQTIDAKENMLLDGKLNQSLCFESHLPEETTRVSQKAEQRDKNS